MPETSVNRSNWLGYCTNVHYGHNVASTRKNLVEHAVAVSQRLAWDEPLGIGLWLAADAARELRREGQCEELAGWLAENRLVPFTLNGFPYGDFHQPVVKHDVYLPSWQDAARYNYTLDLIEILHSLLPAGMEGSISTLPLRWGQPRPAKWELDQAAIHLLQIAERLERLEQETGRLIYLCLEPEPGCVLQQSEDVVQFFRSHLLSSAPEDGVLRYLRVCHDVCHAAVMFESQQQAFENYREQGIRVGKVQISSAVVVSFDTMPEDARVTAVKQLEAFAEDRYLHQTTVRSAPDSPAVFFEDLPQALRLVEAPRELTGQWRIHFHVPIYLHEFGLLETSQSDIEACLCSAACLTEVSHWEVETYAWNVLPAELQTESLADGISHELQWFCETLNKHAPGGSG